MARAVHSEAQQRRTAACSAVGAADVQVGLLLAGEGQIGQVFGGCRRAHRDRQAVAAQLFVRVS